MALGVFIGLGAVILVISTLLIFGATRDPLLQFLSWIKDFFFQFMNIMPKQLKYLMFLFFILTFVGGIINGFIGFMYFCDGDTVYQPTSFFTGVGLAIGSAIQGEPDLGNLTTDEYQSILNNNSVLYSSPGTESPEGLFIIQCHTNKPRLTLFGIRIFDYRTWIFLTILGVMIWLYMTIHKK